MPSLMQKYINAAVRITTVTGSNLFGTAHFIKNRKVKVTNNIRKNPKGFLIN